MKESMAKAAATAAFCVAFAGLLMVWPNFLAFFIASILVSYAVVNVRRVCRRINEATGLSQVFTEGSGHGDTTARTVNGAADHRSHFHADS